MSYYFLCNGTSIKEKIDSSNAFLLKALEKKIMSLYTIIDLSLLDRYVTFTVNDRGISGTVSQLLVPITDISSS